LPWGLFSGLRLTNYLLGPGAEAYLTISGPAAWRLILGEAYSKGPRSKLGVVRPNYGHFRELHVTPPIAYDCDWLGTFSTPE